MNIGWWQGGFHIHPESEDEEQSLIEFIKIAKNFIPCLEEDRILESNDLQLPPGWPPAKPPAHGRGWPQAALPVSTSRVKTNV